MQNNWLKIEKILKEGGIAVIPTDTLYGLCASVFNKKAIEKIYRIKKRDNSKPLIVLISSVQQLKDFNIKDDFIRMFKPKVSILLECKSSKFKYIHRGTNEIAFRLIGKRNKNLYRLVSSIGPIVAPSANPESFKPSENIKQAKKYFKDDVDYYIDGGKKNGKPSTLVRVRDNKFEILRQGEIKIKKE